jgi:SNF2 family DNA or RNA helicase
VCTGVRNPEALRFELADKMVRRTKTQELDIPEKIVQTIPVTLNPKQKALYDEAAEAFWLEIKLAVEHGDVTLEQAENAISKGTIELLIPSAGARLTRLRQIVSTPALLGGEDDSAKLDTAVEIITDNQPKQFVVFCWYEGTTSCLQRRLEHHKPPLCVARITGKTGDPTETVKQFQAGEIDVLCCTIAAGGTGLTLTAADTAIFIEEDWTPALNQQAQDRLWRQGQRNAVTILNLRASGTIDVERIAPKNKLKELIVSSVIGDQ